jgi:hypothetical protein
VCLKSKFTNWGKIIFSAKPMMCKFVSHSLGPYVLKALDIMMKEKPSLQSRFTLLPSKFFPAKFPFSKIQKKILAGKNSAGCCTVLWEAIGYS